MFIVFTTYRTLGYEVKYVTFYQLIILTPFASLQSPLGTQPFIHPILDTRIAVRLDFDRTLFVRHAHGTPPGL